MSDSRDGSPDWLREFQAPTQGLLTLSSTSDSSPELSVGKSDEIRCQEPEILSRKQETVLIDIEEDSPVVKAKKPKSSRIEKKKNKKEDVVEEVPGEEVARDAPAGPSVSSRLPLVFPEKVQRSKALVECDGDAIDLSGDVGAVGRIIISDGPAGKEMTLDLKGNFYKSTIVPSRTFCIVCVGQSEAKIEAVMNDFIQLEPQSNVFEAETMIEGTLEGFSFDSDEEGEKMPKTTATHQSDQNNENGIEAKTKAKRKAETSKGAVRKKAKTAGRPPKTVKKTKKSKK